MIPEMALVNQVQKACPGETTLHEKLRCPNTNWLSLRVHFFLTIVSTKSCFNVTSFSLGKLDKPYAVSRRIPRNVNLVAEPLVFSPGKGTHSLAAII